MKYLEPIEGTDLLSETPKLIQKNLDFVNRDILGVNPTKLFPVADTIQYPFEMKAYIDNACTYMQFLGVELGVKEPIQSIPSDAYPYDIPPILNANLQAIEEAALEHYRIIHGKEFVCPRRSQYVWPKAHLNNDADVQSDNRPTPKGPGFWKRLFLSRGSKGSS